MMTETKRTQLKSGWNCLACSYLITETENALDICPVCYTTRQLSWVCQCCTLLNEGLHKNCVACSWSNKSVEKFKVSLYQDGKWDCPICHHKNEKITKSCAQCRAKSDRLDFKHDDFDDSGSSGSDINFIDTTAIPPTSPVECVLCRENNPCSSCKFDQLVAADFGLSSEVKKYVRGTCIKCRGRTSNLGGAFCQTCLLLHEKITSKVISTCFQCDETFFSKTKKVLCVSCSKEVKQEEKEEKEVKQEEKEEKEVKE